MKSPPSLLGRFLSPGVVLLVVMTTFMTRFALLAHRAIVHGDSIPFGLPLFVLRSRVIQGHASALWTEALFGGHPIFAEGQAAFVSPLPMLLSALVVPLAGPLYAENLFPFFYVILNGMGVLGLSRSLGLSRWASAFAALAVAYSPLWLDLQSNPGVSGTFMWTPWCLWTMEVWLKRPNFRSAAVMALVLANTITAGYAQTFHGTILYMTVSLVTIPFAAKSRRDWAATWRVRLLTGLAAVVLCVGLAAIQLLPLFELVGLSHRNTGIGLQFQFTPDYFFRGLFYTLKADIDRLRSFPTIGSLLVCMAASILIFLRPSLRLVGHLVATLVLLQLGMGNASPFFRLVYDHNIIPGLHYLRGVSLYTAIGCVGVGVMSGAAIDGVAAWLATDRRPLMRRQVLWGLVAATTLWAIELILLNTPEAPVIQYAVVVLAIAGAATLARLGRAKAIPILVTVLLVVECVALRIQPFRLYNPANVAEPDSAKAIKSLPDWQDFKVIDDSFAALISFKNSRSPDMLPGLPRMLSSITGSTPIMWKINGMDGSLALPLARRVMLTPRLADEISGKVDTPPGARLIDLLSIRFVALDNPVSSPAFRQFWHRDGQVWMMENSAARPRFQAYSEHIAVASPEDALSLMESWEKPVLVIENPPGPAHQVEMQDTPASATDMDQPPLTFRIERAKSTSYRLSVSATRPGWLFLADANYPGWAAALDGRPAPLFSAQILGKAVAIPPGQHTLTFEFHSASFRLGAWISLISLALTLVALLFRPKPASFVARPAVG